MAKIRIKGYKVKGYSRSLPKNSRNKVKGKYVKKKGFKVGDIVYNKVYNTVGFIRDKEWRGEIRTSADGNVNVKDLQIFNPSKHKNAQIAPSMKKEIQKKRPTLYKVLKTYKTGKYRYGTQEKR